MCKWLFEKRVLGEQGAGPGREEPRQKADTGRVLLRQPQPEPAGSSAVQGALQDQGAGLSDFWNGCWIRVWIPGTSCFQTVQARKAPVPEATEKESFSVAWGYPITSGHMEMAQRKQRRSEQNIDIICYREQIFQLERLHFLIYKMKLLNCPDTVSVKWGMQ